MISERRRDYYAGGLVVLIGIGAATIATRYQIGSLTKMGPGFFPFALGVLLAILGVMIAVTNFLAGQKGPDKVDVMHMMQTSPDWRGWGCIIGSVLVFIFLADFVGLLAAIFMTVFVACWGDRNATLKSSALLSAGITIFGIGLFYYVLRVQIPIIRGM
jgi:putative Ca2+/H+ antiporter (TMEM165/GDT1 family)